jgi:hypothetical protein
MVNQNIFDRLKAKGIKFTDGLTPSEIRNIEEIYEIKFPDSLYRFYSRGIPFSDDEHGFPRWNDFSDENIAKIKERIEAPLRWLLKSVQTDFWLPDWGKRGRTIAGVTARFAEVSQNAPRLIPIYSHRYMPMLDGVGDPPVISTVGSDIIYYENSLQKYLQNQFLNSEFVIPQKCLYIPFWSDIIEGQDCYFDKLES